jgi:hypothetical protein
LQNDDAVSHCCTFAKDYFVDGTFKICPRGGPLLNVRSSQVLNIFGDVNGHAMLMFTAVMTSRRLPLYEAVLEAIKKHYPNFTPTTIMADFEPSLRKSIKLKFPKTRLLGCR